MCNTNTIEINKQIFFRALNKVDKSYVNSSIPKLGKPAEELVERVFAYELYRQWANLLEEERSEFILNGEIRKIESRILRNPKNRTKYPDLVLHKGQWESEGNEIVCEIKRQSSINKIDNIVNDIEKLKFFINPRMKKVSYTSPYSLGILLVYGSEDNSSIFETIEKHKVKFKGLTPEEKGKILIVFLKYKDIEGPTIDSKPLSQMID